MNAALRDDPGALRINLTAPTTTVRVGPLAFDGLKAFLGSDLTEILGPLMVGARHARATPGGAMLDVYPLALPEGEGLSVPIRLMGEVGFRNLRGLLVLIVPPAVAEVVRAQLADELAEGSAAGPRFRESEGGSIVAEFAVWLRPGMRKAVPLGSWGELGVEAA